MEQTPRPSLEEVERMKAEARARHAQKGAANG